MIHRKYILFLNKIWEKKCKLNKVCLVICRLINVIQIRKSKQFIGKFDIYDSSKKNETWALVIKNISRFEYVFLFFLTHRTCWTRDNTTSFNVKVKSLLHNIGVYVLRREDASRRPNNTLHVDLILKLYLVRAFPLLILDLLSQLAYLHSEGRFCPPNKK